MTHDAPSVALSLGEENGFDHSFEVVVIKLWRGIGRSRLTQSRRHHRGKNKGSGGQPPKRGPVHWRTSRDFLFEVIIVATTKPIVKFLKVLVSEADCSLCATRQKQALRQERLTPTLRRRISHLPTLRGLQGY